MTNDRDKPRRASSHWDDAQRAEHSREIRERARSHPHGVPIVTGEIETVPPDPATPESLDEVTSPHDIIARELTATERALLHTIGGEEESGPLSLLVKLATRVNDIKRVERRDNRARADQILETTGQGSLVDRVASMERALRWWKGAVLAALLAAAGSLVAVGKGLYERGEREGGDAIRLQTLERDTQQLRLDLRDVREDARRHNDRSGWLTPPSSPTTPASTKGFAP